MAQKLASTFAKCKSVGRTAFVGYDDDAYLSTCDFAFSTL